MKPAHEILTNRLVSIVDMLRRKADPPNPSSRTIARDSRQTVLKPSHATLHKVLIGEPAGLEYYRLVIRYLVEHVPSFSSEKRLEHIAYVTLLWHARDKYPVGEQSGIDTQDALFSDTETRQLAPIRISGEIARLYKLAGSPSVKYLTQLVNISVAESIAPGRLITEKSVLKALSGELAEETKQVLEILALWTDDGRRTALAEDTLTVALKQQLKRADAEPAPDYGESGNQSAVEQGWRFHTTTGAWGAFFASPRSNFPEQGEYSIRDWRDNHHMFAIRHQLFDDTNLFVNAGDGRQPNIYAVGRNDGLAVQLKDTSVSRIHCQLQACSKDISILALPSLNGTWVNGQRLDGEQPMKLSTSDRIQIGAYAITYVGFR